MNTTTGIFMTHATAEKALTELRNFGVNESDLSYVYQNIDGDIKDGQTGDKMEQSAMTVGATGAVIGGIAGLIIANGVIPGFGSLVVAGPIAAALGLTEIGVTAVAGAAVGAAAGGLLGALTHLGIDERDVNLYEEHVKKGGILIVARETPTSTEDIFKKCGAVEVRHYN